MGASALREVAHSSMWIPGFPTVETGVLGLLMKQSPGKGNPSPSTRSKKYLLCYCSWNVATPMYVVPVTKCLAVVMVLVELIPMGTSL